MNEHRRYTLKPIVPLIRGGSETDPANLAAWKSNFTEAYDAFFTYLIPEECMTFLHAVSVPGHSFSIYDIRDIKRGIISGKHKRIAGKHYTSHIESRLIDVDGYEDRLLHSFMAQMKHTNVHHIIPQSVGGLRAEGNEVSWPVGFHVLYHRLFENMTLDEIGLFLELINSSYVEQKGMYMRHNGRLVSVSCKKASYLRKLIQQHRRVARKAA